MCSSPQRPNPMMQVLIKLGSASLASSESKLLMCLYTDLILLHAACITALGYINPRGFHAGLH